MYNLLQSIDSEIERSSLLKHRFYRLWSEGKLDVDQLRGYALEYFQLVKAVPQLVRNVMSCCTNDSNLKYVLNENYREESEHINLWIKFVVSMGINSNELFDYVSSDTTNDIVRFLLALTKRSVGQGAAAMYAYEKQLPEISRSKIKGLKEYYNLSNSQAGTEYFSVHEEVDVRHAAVWRRIIEGVSHDPSEALYQAGIDSLRAQNRLLDSVCERYLPPLVGS
jgi:pyrroloquinoline-quinone synthase